MRLLPLLALALALAAPAPAAAAPPLAPGRWRSAGASLRLGLLRGEPRDLAPDAGFGFGAHAEGYAWPHFGLRLAADYDRFAGLRETRTQLSYATFTAAPVAAAAAGRWIGWAAAGGGVAIAYFRSNDLALSSEGPCEYDPALQGRCPASEVALVPVLRAAGGVDFAASRDVRVGWSFEYDVVLSDREADARAVVDGEVGDEVVRRIAPFDDTVHFALTAALAF